jgi:hypothetical protein
MIMISPLFYFFIFYFLIKYIKYIKIYKNININIIISLKLYKIEKLWFK